MRLVATLAVAALACAALAGCGRKAEAPLRSAAISKPAPTPLGFAQSTPDGMAKLTLEPIFAQYPGLRAKLYDDGVRELKSFLVEAHNDHVRMAGEGIPQQRYERTIDWTITAHTPLLLSAKQSWFIYSGGAHPNSGTDVLLWDVVGDRELPGRDLFKAGADRTRLDGVLCDQVKAAKIERDGAVWNPREWPCPKWFDSDFVLAPSTVPDKIGGLTFVFDPYAIGPYVEGSYSVTIPLASFQDALSPNYAGVFAGAPARAAAAKG